MKMMRVKISKKYNALAYQNWLRTKLLYYISIVCIEVSAPSRSKTPTPSFLASAPLNRQTVQARPPYILFFCEPSLKVESVNSQNISELP